MHLARCWDTYCLWRGQARAFIGYPLWTWKTHVRRGRDAQVAAIEAGLAAGVPEPAFAMFVAGFFHDAGAGGEGDAEQHEQGKEWAHDDFLPNAASAGYRRGGSKMWRGL